MATRPVKPVIFPSPGPVSSAAWAKYARDIAEWNLNNPQDPIRIIPGSEEEKDFEMAGVNTPGGELEFDQVWGSILETTPEMSEPEPGPPPTPVPPPIPTGPPPGAPAGPGSPNPFPAGMGSTPGAPIGPNSPNPFPAGMGSPTYELSEKDVVPPNTWGRMGEAEWWDKLGGSSGSRNRLGRGIDTAGDVVGAAAGDPAAIAALLGKVQKEVEDRMKALSSVPGNMMGAIQADTVGETGTEVFQGVENFGRAFEGTGIGDLIEGIGTLGKVTFGAVDALDKLTKGLVEANFRFSDWSGSMAQLKFQQEAFDILISKSKGDARAESTQKLQIEVNKLTETLMPLENQLANAKNEIVTWLVKQANSLEKNYHLISNIVEFLEQWGLKAGDFDETEFIKGLGELVEDSMDGPKRFNIR